MSCRKNYRDLTTVERDRFVQALYHVKSTGIVDDYANEHASHFSHGIHRSSHFLPWHRDFLRRFENALRTYHPDVSIPYWNSTVDTNPSDALWDNGFLGQFDAAWGLSRALGSDSLPTTAQMQATLGLGTYDTFWPDLEGIIHNPPHRWVEGKMTAVDSPADPVFYLHHCWIDLLWAQWQLLNPGAAFVSSGLGMGLNDPMHSVTTTPADVIDHRDINIYDYPPGFQQDLPRVTLDTPVVNFINVPEGETRLGAAVFSLDACDLVHFTVVSGPTLVSGPPTTMFVVMVSPVVANPDLDKKGRLWFTFQGTSEGDIAEGTVTIRVDETGEEFIISLTADTIGYRTAAIVLVLDQSNSMNFDSGIAPGIEREHVLKFSAPPAVDVLEEDHAMAVCSFDHDPHPGIGMTPAAGIGRLTINGAIAGYTPNPNGWTSIGEGVAFAHGILDPVTGYDEKAMVILTDGQENHGPHTRRYITDVADMINAKVYAIGLGRPEVLNPVALTALCDGHDGYMEMTGDLMPDTYFRLAKYYQQIIAGVTNNEIVKDPEGFILPGQEHRIPFWLNETDITAKGILLTPAPFAIRYVLETPTGDIIDPAVAGPHPMAAFEVGSQVSFYRVGLPIPLGANDSQAGTWYARLKVDERLYKRYLASLDNYPTLYTTAAAHGIRYSFSAHAYSNLRMKAQLAQTSNEPGAIITVRPVLTEYGMPLAARATCRAELVRPDNTGITLAMPEIEPGVFETTTPANLAGIYRFRIVAEGRTLRGRLFSRELSLTGAVWRGGDNPPPTVKDDPNDHDDRLCHLLNCLLNQKSIQEALRKAGINPEEVLQCLKEYCRKPSPSQPPQMRKPTLKDRLRSVIRDERVLQTVMREFDRDRE